jgi:hypothetical protein
MFVGSASATLLNPFCGLIYDVRVYKRALPTIDLRAVLGQMHHRLQVTSLSLTPTAHHRAMCFAVAGVSALCVLFPGPSLLTPGCPKAVFVRWVDPQTDPSVGLYPRWCIPPTRDTNSSVIVVA